VVNRTLEKAQELASQLGGEAASFKEMRDLLGSTDIVVSSTDAPGLVIQLDMLEDVMPTRRGSPLLIVDIAVPRDVDPRVSGLEGVVLYDLDDLESLSEANRAKRQKEVAAVEEMIEQETAKFMEQWDSMDVVPVIAALREQSETMRRQELEKTLKRMPDLSEEDTERIKALTRSLIKKMLHSPISVIRERKDLELLDVARDLFSLNGQSPRAEKEPRDT
jgi:glutamyl-tRNA reductase